MDFAILHFLSYVKMNFFTLNRNDSRLPNLNVKIKNRKQKLTYTNLKKIKLNKTIYALLLKGQVYLRCIFVYLNPNLLLLF